MISLSFGYILVYVVLVGVASFIEVLSATASGPFNSTP